MKTNTYVKMSTNTNAMADMKYVDQANVTQNTDMTTDRSTSVKLNVTTSEHPTEIDTEKNKGIDSDVIFTSDKEDNIFNDVAKEDTLGYLNIDVELQNVGETKTTFYFNPLTRSLQEEVGPPGPDNKV